MDLSRQFEPRDAAVAAPTAGALVAVAAVVTALLNPPGGGAPARVLAVGVPALLLLTSLGLLSRRGRRPTPLLTVIPLIGLLAITGLDLATSDASISGYIYFCYPVLYAASQLRPGAAPAVTATAVALSAVVAFALTPPGRAVVDVAYLATTMVAITVVLVRTGSRQDTIVRALEEGKRALTRQATHDVLTGLPNRGLFHERVRQALARSRDNHPAAPSTDRRDPRTRPTIAVLFCDLDGFKAVNDSLGHRAGDDLLVEVARRLRTTLRQDDVVARLGGDEFAVLVLDTDRAGASAVAERLLAALEETVEVAGRGVHVGISIGITLAEPGSDADADRLVREADVAMYEAKAAGRGRCVVFSPVMLATQVEHASLVQDLHGAVSRGEIFVEYQPIVDLTTGRVDGVEALARWAHPERGPVSPAIFVPLAEQAGLIDEIGARVLAEVRADAESFAAAAGRPVSIGVNVSARELTRSRVLDLIDAGRTSSAQLIAEVTESTLLRPDVVPLLAELRRSGVRIAMDDFGVGQSSIAALRLMPADIIKLDRAFTVDVGTDPRALGIVRAVVRMASELEVALVAEGIETTEQREALMALGCRFGQGFLLARPMGARAMRDHLRAASSPAAEADAEAETDADADAGPSRGVDVLPQQRDGSAAHSTAPPRTRW